MVAPQTAPGAQGEGSDEPSVPSATLSAVSVCAGSGAPERKVARFLDDVLRKEGFDVELAEDEDALGRTLELLRERTGAPGAGTALGIVATGSAAAAALTAAQAHADIDAVVAVCGRPDLAGPVLLNLEVPVLLVVGGRDHIVVDLNEQAAAQLRGESRVDVLPGVGRGLPEAGARDAVARLVVDWLTRHLGTRAPDS